MIYLLWCEHSQMEISSFIKAWDKEDTRELCNPYAPWSGLRLKNKLNKK